MKINSLFKQSLTTLVAIILLALVMGGMGFERENFAPSAHAQGGEAEPEQSVEPEQSFEEIVATLPPAEEAPANSQTLQEIVKDVSKLVVKSHKIFVPLTNFFAFQIGNFLDGDQLSQGAMGELRHSLWVTNRNIANIVLVFIFLYNVIVVIILPEKTLGDFGKKTLIFIGVGVGINFTGVAGNVLLDVNYISSNAVMALLGTDNIQQTYDKFSVEQCKVNTNAENQLDGACFPTTIIAPADSGGSRVLYWQDTEGEDDNCAKVKEAYADAYNEDGTKNPYVNGDNEKFQGRTSICMENLNLFKVNLNTSAVHLLFAGAGIANLPNAAASGDGDVLTLAGSIITSYGIQIAYVIGLAFMFLILIVRMIIVFLLLSFSPLLLLMLLFGEAGSNIKQYASIEEGMKWIFIPTKFAVAFVPGFLVINAMQHMSSVTTNTLATKSGFTYKILEQQSLVAGLGSINSLLVSITGLALVWVLPFASVADTKIIGGIATNIKDKGIQFGKWLATSPYWAPIMPVGKGESASFKSMWEGVSPVAKLGEKYEAFNKGGVGPTANLSKRAETIDYAVLAKKIDAGNFEKRDADSLASQLGFRNLEHMMSEDVNTLKAGFRKLNNLKRGGEDKLYEALTDINSGKKVSDAAKAQQQAEQRRVIAEGTAQGMAKNNKPSGGGSQGGGEG